MGRLLLDVVVREGVVRMEVVNCVGQFDFEGDGFAGQCLHEDLHTVVREGVAAPEPFTSEDEALLVRWDTLLDLIDIVGSSRRLHFEGLACDGICKDLHVAVQTEEVESRLLLDVVVG